MIAVTRLQGGQLVLNAELIEFVEATPDTLITLTTGQRLMVRESVADVVARVQCYRREIAAAAAAADRYDQG